MPDRATLLALAEEVEKLTGPSREVDLRIWRLCASAAANRAYWGQRPLLSRSMPEDEAEVVAWRRVKAPTYTGSRDAAAGLMPEGWIWEIRRRAWGFGTLAESSGFDDVEGVAPTEPLARTACALRARAAEMEETDHA